VLAGAGVVHLPAGDRPIAQGSSVYLAPGNAALPGEQPGRCRWRCSASSIRRGARPPRPPPETDGRLTYGSLTARLRLNADDTGVILDVRAMLRVWGGMTWINLDGAVNVRDLGGLPLTAGGTTASGQLIRADNLQELTPGDVKKLVREIGVTVVVDLRSSAELRAEGPAPLEAVAGVRHAHYPVLPELGSAAEVVSNAILARSKRDIERYPDDQQTGHYLGYLDERPDEVAAAVRSIATAGRRGARALRGRQGPDRGRRRAGARRGFGPPRGDRGRLCGDRGAGARDHRTAAPDPGSTPRT